MAIIVNKTFEEIAPGDAVSVERSLQVGDVRAWDAASGDTDVLTAPGESQAATGIVASILTALVGSALPGPGSTIRTVSAHLKSALPISVAMTENFVPREKCSAQGIVVLDGKCTNAAGQLIATAILEVLAPTRRQQREVAEHRLEELIERCHDRNPVQFEASGASPPGGPALSLKVKMKCRCAE
jgi:hypothetical protein